VKKLLLSSVAVLAFAAVSRADELSDIQAQSKQLREQSQALTKRLADIEKRQQKLEQQPAIKAQAEVLQINPADAMAADLPYKAAVKAPTPGDDGLCLHGVCLYGAFDMGVQYIQHGLPYAPLSGSPLNAVVSKNALGSYFGVSGNQLSSTFIGLRGKQEIADDLYAVFNLQSGFNPASGMNDNGPGAIAQNNGLPVSMVNAGGDSSKAGQMFNQMAYFGLSSPTYGTFTMGRQTALSSDLIVNYDPIGGNSWSVLGYLAGVGGGGDTENRIYDNSYEYRVNVGPVRLAAEAQLRNGGNSGTGNAFEGNVGFDYLGFSMDFVAGKIYDAVSSASVIAAQLSALSAAAVNAGNGFLSTTISDNTMFSVAAKYVVGPWKIYAGYEHIDFANPSNPLAVGAFIEGGYIAGVVNNTNFTNNKVLQTVWLAAKYSVAPSLDIVGAWYHEWQNSFATGANAGCATVISTQCSGTLDGLSLVADWRFARHMDLAVGVMWTQVTNGFASGFLSIPPGGNKSSNWDPGATLRYQF
jgi:predicted porin